VERGIEDLVRDMGRAPWVLSSETGIPDGEVRHEGCWSAGGSATAVRELKGIV